MPKLTNKQEQFCKEYLIDLNGTQAAIRAGYSAKTANRIAAENLSKPDIQNYISELMNERSEATGISAERVISELEKIAFAETEITGKEKMKALELLGKHLGMFEAKCDYGNQNNTPDPLSENLKKLAEELNNDQ